MWRPLLLGVFLLSMGVFPATGQPQGTFDHVDSRRASDVAAPLHPGQPEGPGTAVAPGRLELGAEGVSLNGRACPALIGLAGAPVNFRDPMLSDVALGLDPEAVEAWRLTCGEAPAKILLRVDDRVLLLVAGDGSRFELFEAALAPEAISRLQRALLARGRLPGPATGVLDERTLAALAAHAEARGAAYRFRRPLLTRALLRDLEAE